MNRRTKQWGEAACRLSLARRRKRPQRGINCEPTLRSECRGQTCLHYAEPRGGKGRTALAYLTYVRSRVIVVQRSSCPTRNKKIILRRKIQGAQETQPAAYLTYVRSRVIAVQRSSCPLKWFLSDSVPLQMLQQRLLDGLSPAPISPRHGMSTIRRGLVVGTGLILHGDKVDIIILGNNLCH